MTKKKHSDADERVKRENEAEPEELRTWRLIVEHCDELRRVIDMGDQAEEHAERLTADWLRVLQQRNEGSPDGVSDEWLVGWSELSRLKLTNTFRRNADMARDELHQIHGDIRGRPRKTVPPEKLAEKILQDTALKRALSDVDRYLRTGETNDGGDAYVSLFGVLHVFQPESLQSLALLTGEDILDLDQLIADAKARRTLGDHTNSFVRRYVVATVAGLAPGERRLLRLDKHR